MIGDNSRFTQSREDLTKALAECLGRPIVASPQTTSDARQEQRRAFVALWLYSFFLLIFASASLYSAWSGFGSSDWGWFWIAAVLPFLLSALLFCASAYSAWRRHHPKPETSDASKLSVRKLRAAALTQDETLAPPLKPANTLDASPIAAPTTSVFRVLPGQRRYQMTLLAAQAFSTGPYIFIVLLQTATHSPWIFSWQGLVCVPITLALSLWGTIQLIQKVRPFRVTVGEDGLRWREGRRKRFLPWDEARAWCVVFLAPERPRGLSATLSWPNSIRSQPMTALYALIGENASLTWYYQAKPAYAARDSQALAQTIQTKVGLPLRNLTASSEQLYDQLRRERGRAKQATLETKDGPASNSDMAPPVASTAFIFTLSTLIVLAGILTPFAQQQYYGGQMQQLEAAQPQIRDPLTSDALGWTVAPPDKADTFSFTSKGYASERACCNVTSRVPGTMSDGLLEVGMRDDAVYEFDSAGLLFRADKSAHSVLVFTISPDQRWYLRQFTLGDDGSLSQERELRSEGFLIGVGAIRKGQNAMNRLAVLMNGPTYSFFINGQYVGGYRADDLPQAGQVGVYVEYSSGPVTFSDLLISPAPESV
jgi:hypothetical protein